jgi:hypothetical protein
MNVNVEYLIIYCTWHAPGLLRHIIVKIFMPDEFFYAALLFIGTGFIDDTRFVGLIVRTMCFSKCRIVFRYWPGPVE